MRGRLLFIVALPLLLSTPASGQPQSSVSSRLIEYYGKWKNYRKVKHDVLRWHKTTRNGCVAFVSTALRHIGVAVPLREKRNGYGVSRITFAFAEYLGELGWVKLTSVDDLRAGDVVFTTGYPDHVFVFYAWSHRKRRIARALDNKGFLVRRPMFPPRDSHDAAFAYAMRAPPAAARRGRR